MYFATSRYTHAIGEVLVRREWDILRDEADRAYSITDKWKLNGEIIAADAATLLSAVGLLETAYNPLTMNNVTYAGLFYGVGSPSEIYWNAGASITGIQMMGLRYPSGGGVEHLLTRKYEIDLQATFEIAGERYLIGFNERLSYKGNGRKRIGVIETRNTDPVFQEVSQKTPVYLVQEGSATGRFDYPMGYVPNALFPDYLQNPDEAITLEDPKMTPRGIYTNYTVRWSYMHILPSRLNALPNFYPR